MTLDYYAYWNGAQLRDLFEAIVAICSGPDYSGLLRSAALAGFLATITAALLRWQAMAAKTFIFAMMLFYSVLFIPKVTVAIHDERAATVHVVDNVPFGVGFFSSTASQVGKWLTESFESAFAQSDAERFSKFGAVFPQRAVAAIQSAGLITPEGRARMSRFISGCVTPELLDHPHYANALAASSDIWGDITSPGWLNPARSVLTSEGGVLRCDEAANDLDNWIQTEELPEIKRKLGSWLVPDRIDPSSVIMRTLPQAEALLLGVSRTLDESLRHSIMMQSLPEGISSFAQQAGSPLQLAVNLSKAQGNLASEINYRTMSEIAKDALPKLRNAFEFIVIASFPLILVMVLGAGSFGGNILKGFCTMVIWIQLWAPLSAVVNYLLITVDANPMNRIISEYGGNSLLAADLIRQAGASSQALAGSLMLLVPLLAYALAKSSEIAAASMVSSIMSPAQSAASAASGQMASGNVSAGNVSLGNTGMNNVSASKNDVSSSFSDPYSSKVQTAYGSVTRDGSGFVTGMSRTPIDLGVSTQSSMTEGKSASVNSTSTTGLTRTEAASLAAASGAVNTDRSSADFSNALSMQLQKGQSLNSSWSSQEVAGSMQSAGTMHSASESLQTTDGASYASGLGTKAGIGGRGTAAAASGGVSPQNGTSLPTSSGTLQKSAATSDAPLSAPKTLSGKAGAALGKLGGIVDAATAGAEKGFSAQTGLSVQSAQNLIHMATGADMTIDAATRAKAFATLNQAAENVANSTSDSKVAQEARTFQAALEKSYRQSLTSSIQSSEGKQFSRSNSRQQTGQSSVSVNNDVVAMNMATSQSGSAEKALENLGQSRQFRENLGAHLAADNNDSALNPERMGPAQISGNIGQAQGIRNTAKKQISGMLQKSSVKVGTADADYRKDVGGFSIGTGGNPTPEAFEEKFNSRVNRTLGSLEDRSNITVHNAAANRKEVEDYQRQKGVGTVMSIALAGGLGYQDPRNKTKKRDEN